MLPLRQSTATVIRVGPIMSPSDGVTPVTGLAAPSSTKLTLTKNGVPAAYTVAGWAEFGNGLYTILLSTTDTGATGRLVLDFGDGAIYDPFFHEFSVMSQAAYDFLYGSSSLPTNVIQWGGTAVGGLPSSGNVTVGGYAANQDPASYVLSTPTNKLATDASGRVTSGTVADKSGYALNPSQAFNNTGQTTKLAATLAPADVTGNLPANAVQWGGTAVAGMPLASGSFIAPDNASIAAIKLKTDTLPASPAATGDIQAGLTTQGYTSARAAKLDNNDAAVSSRLAAGSYTPPNPVSAIASAILASPANKLATNADGSINVNLSQAVPLTNTAQSVGDALNAARAQGFGPWALNANARTLTLYASDGITAVRTFTLDSATSPSSRI